MLTEQKNVSGSVYVKVVVSSKSKVNSHYLDNGDAMDRLLSNQTTLPCIENLHQETFCRYESICNFRKFEKFRKNYFVPILPCKKSKVKKKILSLMPRKWESSFQKWILSQKHLQSRLNYNFNFLETWSTGYNQTIYIFLQHLLLHLKIRTFQVLFLWTL